MDNTANILILGHSFVRRLQTFLTEHHDRRAAHNMNLPHENISFLGIGGRTVSKMLSFDLDKIKAFQPKVIILELGTNDLCVIKYRFNVYIVKTMFPTAHDLKKPTPRMILSFGRCTVPSSSAGLQITN